MRRRTAGQIVAVLLVAAALGCGREQDQSAGMMDENGGMSGMMAPDAMGDMPEWMMSRGQMMDPAMMRDMPVIHRLLTAHTDIQREVEDIPGGIRSVTTSADPDVTQLIRTHVRQMKERLEEGQPIRRMDPVFRELFRHHDMIEMEIEDIPGGVRVVETSEDPQVMLLIRHHARHAVSEFVEEGMRRAMQPTPLPDGYARDN